MTLARPLIPLLLLLLPARADAPVELQLCGEWRVSFPATPERLESEAGTTCMVVIDRGDGRFEVFGASYSVVFPLEGAPAAADLEQRGEAAAEAVRAEGSQVIAQRKRCDRGRAVGVEERLTVTRDGEERRYRTQAFRFGDRCVVLTYMAPRASYVPARAQAFFDSLTHPDLPPATAKRP